MSNLRPPPGLLINAYDPGNVPAPAPQPTAEPVGLLAANAENEVLSFSRDFGVNSFPNGFNQDQAFAVGKTKKRWKGIDVYVDGNAIPSGMGPVTVRVFALANGGRYLRQVGQWWGQPGTIVAQVRGRASQWEVEIFYQQLTLAPVQIVTVTCVASDEDATTEDKVGMWKITGHNPNGFEAGSGVFPRAVSPPTKWWTLHGQEVRTVVIGNNDLGEPASMVWMNFFSVPYAGPPAGPVLPIGTPALLVLPSMGRSTVYAGPDLFRGIRFFECLAVQFALTPGKAISPDAVYPNATFEIWMGGT